MGPATCVDARDTRLLTVGNVKRMPTNIHDGSSPSLVIAKLEQVPWMNKIEYLLSTTDEQDMSWCMECNESDGHTNNEHETLDEDSNATPTFYLMDFEVLATPEECK